MFKTLTDAQRSIINLNTKHGKLSYGDGLQEYREFLQALREAQRLNYAVRYNKRMGMYTSVERP